MIKKRLVFSVLLIAVLFLAGACKAVSASLTSVQAANEQQNVPELPAMSAQFEDAPVKPDSAEEVEAAVASPVDYPSKTCMLDLKKMLDVAYGNDDSISEDSGRRPVRSKFTDSSEDDSVTLVSYSVKGDDISSPVYGKKVPSEYKKYVKDTELHQRIWKVITDIVPVDQRKDLDTFILFTDGEDNITGSVGEGSTPETWSFEMDVLDSEDLSTMTTTLVHEFGHMLTLGESQIKYYATTCKFYMASDGCSKENSYVNKFYDQFWWDTYDEWASMANPDENGEVDEDGAYAFYEKYPDRFVSDYAATHPEEDIAESWTYFVYSDPPEGNTLADQKVRFFYMFPELVELRAKMLNGLCEHTKE